jgi:hypothetical protein
MYFFVGTVVNTAAFAGIRVGNLSRNYAGTSKNTMAMQTQYYNTMAEPDVYVEQKLPIQVANQELAEKIRNNDSDASTNIETLNKCATIYPDGEFVWDKPTVGRSAGGSETCVAVVEMRAIGANGSLEYTTVARGKLAAGDSFNCNISSFPSSAYLPDITRVVFPADNKPTREDVIRVMNEEQKNKAGLKIAAAALVGGIGGNMVGKSAPGSDSLFGTNSEKITTTAEGALLGAALMTASTYSGKVAGDVILNTGVNAAAGAVVGNMAAVGESVLRVEKCNDGGIETTCLWGNITKTSNERIDNAFYDINSGDIYICDDSYKKCKLDNSVVLKSIQDQNGKSISLSELEGSAVKNVFQVLTGRAKSYVYRDNGSGEKEMYESESGALYPANVAKRAGAPVPAVIVGFRDSIFGTKIADWYTWKSANGKSAQICLRDSKGNPYNCETGKKTDDKDAKDTIIATYTIDDFSPLRLDADDGGVVDFSNKARLGSTLKGAGVGGALGGFAGYQGAQSDIEERFVLATREYNDSLEKFYCGSGRKFLSFYNDEVIIPEINKK